MFVRAAPGSAARNTGALRRIRDLPITIFRLSGTFGRNRRIHQHLRPKWRLRNGWFAVTVEGDSWRGCNDSTKTKPGGDRSGREMSGAVGLQSFRGGADGRGGDGQPPAKLTDLLTLKAISRTRVLQLAIALQAAGG